MIFWDSSALVALLVEEPASAAWRQHLVADSSAAVWWGTAIECESALQRRLREKSLNSSQAKVARDLLGRLSASSLEIPASPGLRQLALRLLRTHPLRAADAVQLAAALTLAGGGVENLGFASADARLNDAAQIENLRVLG